MSEILKQALIISDEMLERKCCNKEFREFVENEITNFQREHFPPEFIQGFWVRVSLGDRCKHITYIIALFATIDVYVNQSLARAN